MKKDLKIIYIITLPSIGGAQVHLKDVIINLPNFIESYLIVGNDGWIVNMVSSKTKKIFVVDDLIRDLSPIHDIKALLSIIKIINKIKPDIVHCHSSKAGIIGRLAASICGVKSIFTAHGWAFTEGVNPIKRLIYKMIETIMSNYTNKIICVSEYDRNLALKAMGKNKDKIITIHNGIGPLNIDYKNANIDEIRVVMVARFCEPKRQKEIIDAIDFLYREYKLTIKLSLIGDGPNLIELKKYTEKLESNAFIEFTGEKYNISELLYNYNIFVLLSMWEGFPLSILEAMRQGLVVIASDVGGINEAVANSKSGFLIPRGDNEMLRDKLQYLYCNRDEIIKMGELGKKIYSEKFTTEIMMENIIKIYKDILYNEK